MRLQYLDQPLGEFLRIAMTPVARYTGELVDFTVGNGGAGLVLVGGNGDPAATVPGAVCICSTARRRDRARQAARERGRPGKALMLSCAGAFTAPRTHEHVVERHRQGGMHAVYAGTTRIFLLPM